MAFAETHTAVTTALNDLRPDGTPARTDRPAKVASAIVDTTNAIGKEVSTLHQNVTDTVVLTLSKAWIGLGLVKKATTDGSSVWGSVNVPEIFRGKQNAKSDDRIGEASTGSLDRYDYKKLWSVQIGDYFMPVSQQFSLRAKKRLNVASLVDGIDIIQQTRKEAKTIDCSLRLTLRNNQPNLEIVKAGEAGEKTLSADAYISDVASYLDGNTYDGNAVQVDDTRAAKSIERLATFLTEFYENDAVFRINNQMINDTFGVNYVFISEYKFTPKVGMGTFQFDFSLTEVIYGDDVMTFDVREING